MSVPDTDVCCILNIVVSVLILRFISTLPISTLPRSHLLLSLLLVQILDEGRFPKQYQWQNRSITEWTSQQVALWLMGLNLEHLILEFTARNIDGEQLLRLDSTELKVG